MKRKTKTIEKRTYSMKGAIPRFVSLVSRGANFTPLSQLRYDDTEQFGQDVEINRIEFSKAKFTTVGEVEAYLNDNAYEDFEVADTGETWTVAGAESEAFEDISPIEYEDGVLYFVGKLKATEEVDAPAAEVVAKEEFGDTTSQELPMPALAEQDTQEELAADSNEEADETAEEEETEDEESEEAEDVDDAAKLSDMQPSDAVGTKPDVATKKKLKKKLGDEEANTATEATASQEGEAGFSAESVEQEEEKVTYTQEEFVEKFAALEAKIAELEEKLAKFETKEVDTIDETEIVIQNSQAVNSDEITIVETKEKDERAEKFAQERRNDLFGLRG